MMEHCCNQREENCNSYDASNQDAISTRMLMPGGRDRYLGHTHLICCSFL
jgi:hypothetical protein